MLVHHVGDQRMPRLVGRLPILKTKKAPADMASGQLLKVVATDSSSLRDFQAFAKQTGNELVEQQTVGEEFIHVLRRR